MRRRTLLRTAGTLAVASLAGCAGDLVRQDTTSDETTGPPGTVGPVTDGLELRKRRLVRENQGSESELVKVAATAANVGDEALADVSAEVDFRDDEGTVLETATQQLDELGTGRTWSFEIYYSGAGSDARAVVEYRLSVETAD